MGPIYDNRLQLVIELVSGQGLLRRTFNEGYCRMFEQRRSLGITDTSIPGVQGEDSVVLTQVRQEQRGGS